MIINMYLLFYGMIIAIILIIFFIRDNKNKENVVVEKFKKNILTKTEELSKYLLLH